MSRAVRGGQGRGSAPAEVWLAAAVERKRGGANVAMPVTTGGCLMSYF